MLTRPKNSSTGWQYWAQIGWSRLRTSTGSYLTRIFTSWTDNAGNYWVVDYDLPAANETYYTLFIPGSPSKFRLSTSSSDYGLVTAGWTPTSIQIYGETHNLNTQMPGDTSNKVSMDLAKYLLLGEATWRDMASTAGANNAEIYGATKVNNTTYEIWDKNCASAGGN